MCWHGEYEMLKRAEREKRSGLKRLRNASSTIKRDESSRKPSLFFLRMLKGCSAVSDPKF